MDLEVVGRHALFFDDDALASFVNSPAALVDWNSLSIDRYDVRHLLSSPPPPRKRRRHPSPPPQNPDEHLESELDLERYQDLPPASPSASDRLDGGNGKELGDTGGYNAVPFSYGNTGESTERKDTDDDCSFRPPFPVPESLLQSLPPTEKLHQIIARTAMFVSKHGGQSEIVLRVKQGDNPTFGFLMPDHPLHTYFRFLVDHQDLLNGKSLELGKSDTGSNQTGGVGGGGALSLLGSVYGSGEDEEATAVDGSELQRNGSIEDVLSKTVSNGSEQKESFVNVDGKDEADSKHSPHQKEKASFMKRNQPITTVKAGITSGVKKDNDASVADKRKACALPSKSKVELPVVEPPSDLKRVVDKIVEFIVKNGRQFEAVLIEQDVKHGRFPFLLASNVYHSYYLEVLQNAQESKLLGKNFTSEKSNSSSYRVDKKAAPSRQNDTVSVGSDMPYDPDRKEKFKMVLGKAKKDGEDSSSKASQQQTGVSVDAAAAAAILQAARRGIRNPSLEVLSKKSQNGSSQAYSSEGGLQPQTSNQKPERKGEPIVSAPVASAIAKTAAIAAASEADSSEASLTKEQKIKAERLKRAKMFAAMIRSGAAPPKVEPSRGLSVEPSDSGISGSGVEVVRLLGKEREGSSVPFDVDSSDKVNSEQKLSGEDNNGRCSKRKYRSRLERHGEDNQPEEDEVEGKERDHKRSGTRRESHSSSPHNIDSHKHRRNHSSSKDRDLRHQHKHGRSNAEQAYKPERPSEDEHQHSRHRWKHDNSSTEETRCSQRHCKFDSSSNEKQDHSQHRHKHKASSKDEHRNQRKRSHLQRETELEEGEICAKSGQSKASESDGASREASVDLSKLNSDGRVQSLPSNSTTVSVSDELRAKIRAMLMATL